jgi:hypothetical protein
MKTRSAYLGFAMTACLGAGLVPCAAQTAPATKPSLNGAVLEIRTDRPSYVLGDLVTLEVTARNRSATSIALPRGFDVWVGHVGVMIAFEDGPFREYRGPGWGLRDVAAEEAIALLPRQSVNTEATILYNHGLESRHLNREAAERITGRYLDEGYGLAVAGRYQIKAVFYGAGFEETIESKPVEIRVEEPQGRDLEVWNLLRGDHEIGYFIQAGSPGARSSAARRQRLIDVLEKLVTHYPEGRHAERLRDQLSNYRELIDDLTARGLIIR